MNYNKCPIVVVVVVSSNVIHKRIDPNLNKVYPLCKPTTIYIRWYIGLTTTPVPQSIHLYHVVYYGVHLANALFRKEANPLKLFVAFERSLNNHVINVTQLQNGLI